MALFRGRGCATEAGLSASGTPLTQLLSHASNEFTHAPWQPASRAALPQFGGPMLRPQAPLEQAWLSTHAVPQLGAAMGSQLGSHMRPTAAAQENFFHASQLASPAGAAWVQEFSATGPVGVSVAPHQALRLPQSDAPGAMFQVMPGLHGPCGLHANPFNVGVHPPMGMCATSVPPPAAIPVATAAAPQDQELRSEDVLQDDHDLMQSAQMVEMFRSSGNAKFVSSQFVDFVDKVSKKELFFNDKAVVDQCGEIVDWDALYEVSPAEPTVGTATNHLAGSLSDAQVTQALMAMSWPSASCNTRANVRVDKDAMTQLLFSEGASVGSSYKFVHENHYLTADDPLALAKGLLEQGHDRAALLALEAEVQKHSESSEGWRQLGQLRAEADEDDVAMQCFQRGLAADPYNLESLLALGICCINDQDQFPALRCLRTWMERHDDYQSFTEGLEPPMAFDVRGWQAHLADLALRAAEMKPDDADVHTILGLAELMRNNISAAVRALVTACRLRSEDHAAWNRLGSALAMGGSSQQACVAFEQALQLKPSYARCWSNLAAVHARLGNFTESTRLHLSSLVLNPKPKHAWRAARNTALELTSADDLIDAIDDQDLQACARLVEGVLDPALLPARIAQLPHTDEILTSLGL